MGGDAGTWWRAHNADIEAMDAEDRRWLEPDALLPPHVVELLDAVEVRFAADRTVADWPDRLADDSVEGGLREAREDEYSRVSHPERYRIIGERVDAWVDELVGRGLATVEGAAPPPRPRAMGGTEAGTDWVLLPHEAMEEVRVVRPTREGALPLVLGGISFEEGRAVGMVIGTGDPFVELSLHPGCGCDACDSGSADLLQSVDEDVLPIVDGSLRGEVTEDGVRWAWAGGAMGTTHPPRSERRARRSALGGRTYAYAGVPWDAAWPLRPTASFI